MKKYFCIFSHRILYRTTVLFVLSIFALVFVIWNASRTAEESRNLSNIVLDGIKNSIEENGSVPPILADTDIINSNSPTNDGNETTEGEVPKIEVNTYYLNIFVRKTGHILEYTLLAFFVSLTLISHGLKKDVSFLSTLLFGLTVACCDELIQSQTSGRCGRLNDVLIDSCGCIMGAFFAICVILVIYRKVFSGKRQKNKENPKKICQSN